MKKKSRKCDLAEHLPRRQYGFREPVVPYNSGQRPELWNTQEHFNPRVFLLGSYEPSRMDFTFGKTMEFSSRSFDAPERRKLSKKVTRTTNDYIWGSMGVFIILAVAFAAIAWTVEKTIPLLGPHLPFLEQDGVSGYAIAILFFVFFLWLRRKLWASPMTKLMKIDYENGIANAYKVNAIDSIFIPEEEDEGHTVFLETDSEEVLAFSGQFLEHYVRAGFPWSEFEIVEAPKSKFLLRFKRIGPQLKYHRSSEKMTIREAKGYGIFECKWKVLDVPFKTLKEKYGEPNQSSHTTPASAPR